MLAEALFFSAVLFIIGVVGVLTLLAYVMSSTLSLCSAYHPGAPDPAAERHAAAPSSAAAHETHAAHEVSASGAQGDDHPVAVRHRFATLTSIIGAGVMVLAFGLAVAIFLAMQRAGSGDLHAPFVQRYFEWMPVGDLRIDAAFQLDQLS